MDYGFRNSKSYRPPEPADAIRLIHRALDLGINLIDTAREYGSSEELIGKALRSMPGRALLASKAAVSAEDLRSGNLETVRRKMLHSIESSLRCLQTNTIDILQVHNTSMEVLQSEEILRVLENARLEGKVRFLGASCEVGHEVPLAALRCGVFDVLQVPFNVLNQQLAPTLVPRAAHENVGIMARSVFLRGVLTKDVHSLPDALAPLRGAALAALEEAKDGVQGLSELALRFCLSFEQITTLVVGVRSVGELELNINDAGKGSLPAKNVEKLRRFCMHNEALTNPQNWKEIK
jgi:aryl-alcohol dehydrogenase-like predicted oxidoreductase